jgi:uncharacterized protein with von Willebrand factor type A (vWA) domain
MLEPRTALEDGGRLAENVLHFSRVLRHAGLPLGTDRPLLALAALEVAGLESRAELRSVLEACLIDRIEHRALFRQAFEIFWRDPRRLGEGLAALSPPQSTRPPSPAARAVSRRLAEALWRGPSGARSAPDCAALAQALEFDPSSSAEERLRQADFDTLTSREWVAAARAVAALGPLIERVVCRREKRSDRGSRPDLRRALRESARRGGDMAALPRRTRGSQPARVIALVDISGSMSRYSRMFMYFLHALANAPAAGSRERALRCAALVFGTRLTPITRDLEARDADEAIARVSRRVEDWSGGTRIGECLGEFNRSWAKRLPLSSATVLLVTDGLERADCERLAHEAARLKRSCRRLIWLNPLLRYEAFEPKARGVRAILPHADRLLSIHNIASLERLADLLASSAALRFAARAPEATAWR